MKGKQKKYLCDYQYEGKTYCIEISASSWEDAQARLRQLGYGKVVGEIHLTLPVCFGWANKIASFFGS